MDYRIGVCSSCRANFKIPASFTPNQARCRTCSGVVEIGPVRSDDEVHAPAPEQRAPRGAHPQRENAPAPRAQPQPFVPVARGNQSASAAAPAPANAPAHAPAHIPAPAPARPAAAAPAASAAREPVAPGAAPARARSAPAAVAAQAPASRASTPAPARKKRLVPVLTVVLILGAVGVGVWLMLGGEKTGVAAHGGDAVQSER